MFISDLIIKDKAPMALDDLFLEPDTRKQFDQLIKEHGYSQELASYGLPLSNKVLLHGSSGCGKTATAKAIAAALGKEILILNLSNVTSARMGETAQNIKMVFDRAIKDKAVLFLDEFDQIAKLRSLEDRDVGEMRRLVTSIIQLIDYYPQDALLICATNHLSFIDPAIVRRFELVVGYNMPSPTILDEYYEKLLSPFPPDLRGVKRIYETSFAQAKDHTLKAVKAILIEQLDQQSKLKQT